jgi:hypothetical protein
MAVFAFSTGKFQHNRVLVLEEFIVPGSGSAEVARFSQFNDVVHFFAFAKAEALLSRHQLKSVPSKI